MRVRKKKNAPKRMAACADCLIQSIHELPLAADRPLHLEIGCGKGTFIVTLAKQNPDVFYLAVERVFDVALLTAEKIAAQGLENVKLMVAGAEQLPELLPGELGFANILKLFRPVAQSKARQAPVDSSPLSCAL